MLYYQVILVLLFGYAAANLLDPLKFSDQITITPVSKHRGLFSDAGIVPGARSCGGAGKFVRFRYEPCITGNPPPCLITTDPKARSEMTFVPSQDFDGVGVRITILTLDGQAKVYENLFENEKLTGGQEYSVSGAGGPSMELRGKQYMSQVEIFRQIDKHVETCVQADFYVI